MDNTIKEGDILTFDVLEWFHEGYAFGRPCLMLSPIITENSDSNPDSMIESILIDLTQDRIKVGDNLAKAQIKWRGWNLKYLRKCFNTALNGKDFPKAGYKATRYKVRIIKGSHGNLFWEAL